MKDNKNNSLYLLFKPRNVAIFEAKDKISYFIEGFKVQGFNLENLYLISPTIENLLGLRCYKSFDDIPSDSIDLLILSVRRESLVQSLKYILINKKINFVHIFTAGTGESDEIGVNIEKQLKELLNTNGVTRAIGPNCMGIYCPGGKNAYYPSFPVETGNIGLIFQSGDLHSKMIKFGSKNYNLRFSKGVSVGNCMDLQISDFLLDFANDNETDLICVYFEGFSSLHGNEGKKLLGTLKTMTIPVLFMRGGRTKRGQTAVLTHTGSMATRHDIWNAIYKQTPIIEVPPSLDELIDYAYIFYNIINRFKKLNKEVVYPENKRALVVLWSGGFGILATDTLTELGIEMPYFQGIALEKLKKMYPGVVGSLANPLDLPWITQTKTFVEVCTAAIDENVDLVIIETDAWSDMESEGFKSYYNNLVKIKDHTEALNKIFTIILHHYPSESRNTFYNKLVKDDFLVYPTIERAAKSFLAVYEYGKKKKRFNLL